MNRLAEETSPYLRQHRDNPVDWYPWGDEAFARARAEDRPILLSVGYSACHWCHVMAHECFEDDEVAAAMNDRFVCVKVDREERPDVDAVYMEAVQAISGRGGWPMTVFMAPDGQPFYGGTYYPKPTFLQLMDAVDEAWRTNRHDLLDQAGELTEIIGRTGRLEPAEGTPGVDALNAALGELTQRFDADDGGFGRAPKFPSSTCLELVLRAHAADGSADALQMVTTSLDAMASGGLYDHLGGGFARYSTDDHWLVPHFEKMLYDQALLARIYLHGHQATGNPNWRLVVEETIGYVLRDLRHPEGGFFSAEDADSPDEHGRGHEGLFHTWTPEEIEAVLGADAGTASDWFGVTGGGNFEGRSILHRRHARGELVRPAPIEAVRRRLFEARERRRRPGLDDKVLTEWNALMLTTLAEAAAVLDRADWLAAAVANGEFLLGELRDGDRWHRSWQADAGSAGRARHDALAADHAAVVEAFVALATATGEARWVREAVTVADAMLARFWDAQRGGLYTAAVDTVELVARQKDLMDNATPSANSMAANGLERLAVLTGDPRYANHAEQILRLAGAVMAQAPSAFSHLLAVVDQRRGGATEIVITGDRPDLVRAARRPYLPNAVVVWGERYESPLWEGRTDGLAYVCHGYACQAPVTTPEALTTQLDSLTRA